MNCARKSWICSSHHRNLRLLVEIWLPSNRSNHARQCGEGEADAHDESLNNWLIATENGDVSKTRMRRILQKILKNSKRTGIDSSAQRLDSIDERSCSASTLSTNFTTSRQATSRKRSMVFVAKFSGPESAGLLYLEMEHLGGNGKCAISNMGNIKAATFSTATLESRNRWCHCTRGQKSLTTFAILNAVE